MSTSFESARRQVAKENRPRRSRGRLVRRNVYSSRRAGRQIVRAGRRAGIAKHEIAHTSPRGVSGRRWLGMAAGSGGMTHRILRFPQ